MTRHGASPVDAVEVRTFGELRDLATMMVETCFHSSADPGQLHRHVAISSCF